MRYRVSQPLRPPFQFRAGGPAFTSTITTTIQTELSRLERDEPIRVVYACESGSRAWGFASSDSVYDVRFVYIRSVDWYLSLDNKRDVLERMLPHDIDLSGWTFKKL